MTCINLKDRYGDQYRIEFDPAYNPRKVPGGKLDPWYMVIPCRRGSIHPHGGNLLAVDVDYRAVTAKRVAALDGVALHQDGDCEKTFVFHVDLFDEVAKLVRPRRRRRLTEQQRRDGAARLRKHRFRSRRSGRPQRRETGDFDAA